MAASEEHRPRIAPWRAREGSAVADASPAGGLSRRRRAAPGAAASGLRFPAEREPRSRGPYQQRGTTTGTAQQQQTPDSADRISPRSPRRQPSRSADRRDRSVRSESLLGVKLVEYPGKRPSPTTGHTDAGNNSRPEPPYMPMDQHSDEGGEEAPPGQRRARRRQQKGRGRGCGRREVPAKDGLRGQMGIVTRCMARFCPTQGADNQERQFVVVLEEHSPVKAAVWQARQDWQEMRALLLGKPHPEGPIHRLTWKTVRKHIAQLIRAQEESEWWSSARQALGNKLVDYLEELDDRAVLSFCSLPPAHRVPKEWKFMPRHSCTARGFDLRDALFASEEVLACAGAYVRLDFQRLDPDVQVLQAAQGTR